MRIHLIDNGRLVVCGHQEYESALSTGEGPTCDDLVEFYTG